MDKNNIDTVRLLILDTEGVYTKIYDEVYVEKSEVNNIMQKYQEYLIVEIPEK